MPPNVNKATHVQSAPTSVIVHNILPFNGFTFSIDVGILVSGGEDEVIAKLSTLLALATSSVSFAVRWKFTHFSVKYFAHDRQEYLSKAFDCVLYQLSPSQKSLGLCFEFIQDFTIA